MAAADSDDLALFSTVIRAVESCIEEKVPVSEEPPRPWKARVLPCRTGVSCGSRAREHHLPEGWFSFPDRIHSSMVTGTATSKPHNNVQSPRLSLICRCIAGLGVRRVALADAQQKLIRPFVIILYNIDWSLQPRFAEPLTRPHT